MSGSHGNRLGDSVLFLKELYEGKFYIEDCAGVGIKPEAYVKKRETSASCGPYSGHTSFYKVNKSGIWQLLC